MSASFDPFARHRQEKSEEPGKRPRRSGTPPILLHWLRNRWPGTTVCARDIYRHGPNPMRDRKIALDLAEESCAGRVGRHRNVAIRPQSVADCWEKERKRRTVTTTVINCRRS